LGSFDARLFLDVNVFAERTVWAHSFMRDYADFLGLILLGFLILVAGWRSRGGALALGERDASPDAMWTPLAAFAAFGIAIPLAHLIGRARPYGVHQQVEVLVTRVSGASLPSEYAAVVGAVLAGLWLTRERIVAGLAALVGVFLCFAQVYVGAQYVGDEVAGVALGVVVLLLVRPLALPVISLARDSLSSLGRRPAPLMSLPFASPGEDSSAPADVEGAALDPRPQGAGRSGTVRILETDARVVPHVAEALPAGRGVEPATTHVHKVAPPSDGPSEVPITGT
jgi:membrane-associated phospholipid phosphatase